MNKKPKTDFLTPESSFFTGVESCINLVGNYSCFDNRINYDAILTDLQMADKDFRAVMDQFFPNHNCL